MLFLVAYDISAPNRLRKVAKICESYGVRVEKSVFECDLPQDVFETFWLKLIDVAEEDEDALVAYRLCKSCIEHVETIGVMRPEKERLFYFL